MIFNNIIRPIQSYIIDCTSLSRKKYYESFTDDEWNEICDADVPSCQNDEFIEFNNKLSLYIKELFKWMDNEQSNIFTLPSPSFEESSLNIQANIYNFILQSMYVKLFLYILYILFLYIYIYFFNSLGKKISGAIIRNFLKRYLKYNLLQTSFTKYLIMYCTF